MSTKHIKTLAEFNQALEDAGNKLVVVDFYAEWCPPCKRIAPLIEALAKENPDVVFLKVDVDEATDISEEKKISAMPTFQFYKSKDMVAEFTGADENGLKKKVAELK